MPQAVSTTAYNAANHQTTFGDKALTYDNNGNLQTLTDASGTTMYTWNARNQLVGISGPGVSATFVYDGLGRREKKTINSNVTEFLYDGLNPVQETSGAAILANILPGLGIDEFLTRTDVVAGVTSNFLTDALGSPVAVTDNTGVVQTEYTYEPFGKATFSGNSNSSSYQYTGRENDGTGLFYYRNRYYHPQLQRFISEDPIELEGGDVNFYAYVWNNSLNFIDPEGYGGTAVVFGRGNFINRGILRPSQRYVEQAAQRHAGGSERVQPPPRYANPAEHPGAKRFNDWYRDYTGEHPHEPNHFHPHDPHHPHPYCPPGIGNCVFVPPTPPGGGQRKDQPPFPGCSLGLSGLCPDPSA